MFPAGITIVILLGTDVSIADWWLWNQIPVLLGNVVGGFAFTGPAPLLAFRAAPKDVPAHHRPAAGHPPHVRLMSRNGHPHFATPPGADAASLTCSAVTVTTSPFSRLRSFRFRMWPAVRRMNEPWLTIITFCPG